MAVKKTRSRITATAAVVRHDRRGAAATPANTVATPTAASAANPSETPARDHHRHMLSELARYLDGTY